MDSEDDESAQEDPSDAVSFRYNPLHDLEAYWWLCGYLLMLRDVMLRGEDEATAYNPNRKKLHEFCHSIFEDKTIRQNTFTVRGRFSAGVKYLHISAQTIGNSLDLVRKELIKAYKKAEKDLKHIDNTVAAHVYAPVSKVLETICQALQRSDIILSSIHTNMVVELPEPRHHPAGVSYDTRANLGARTKQSRHANVDDDVFGPLAASVSRLVDKCTENIAGPRAKRAKVTPTIGTNYALHVPRDPTAGPATPSDDGEAIGGPIAYLAAASSMMSVTTTVGDISSLPVDEAAGLSISGSRTANPHPSSSSAAQSANSDRQAKPRKNAKPSGKGRGKEKASAEGSIRRSSRNRKPSEKASGA